MHRLQRPMSSKLEQARRRFESWRESVGGKGGRGRLIPESLWAEAVEVARAVGIGGAARALRLNPSRLAKRVSSSEPPAKRAKVARVRVAAKSDVRGEFVELDANEVFMAGRTVIQLIGRDGERLRIDMADASAVDLVEVAVAFWSRGG